MGTYHATCRHHIISPLSPIRTLHGGAEGAHLMSQSRPLHHLDGLVHRAMLSTPTRTMRKHLDRGEEIRALCGGV